MNDQEAKREHGEHGEHCYRWHHEYDHPCCECGEPGTPCPADTCRGCRLALDECECEDEGGNPLRKTS